MRTEAKDRFSIALGAASACSLLWVSGLSAQENEREEGPAAEPSTEEQAVEPLKETVAVLLETLLTDFPDDALLVDLVPELPYLHHPTKAAALLEHALEHNPKNPMLCRLMAEMEFQKGEYETAITYFRKVSELSQQTWEIRNRIAESLMRLGRYQEAVDSLEEKAADSASPGQTDYLLGQAFNQLGDYTKARQYYEKALKENPQDSELAYALGKVYMKLNEPEKAEPYLEAFRKKQLARKSGMLEVAKRRAQPEIHYAAIPVPWERGELANILSTLCVRGATLYRASGRTERAEQVLQEGRSAFEKAIDLAPEQPDLYREFARLYRLTGRRPSKAAQLAEQAVALEPSAQNYLSLGRAYQANAEDRKAISALRRAAELEPGWVAPKNELAWILATHADPAIRRPGEAVRLAERAATLAKRRNPSVLNTLAAAYASTGQFARAARVAENALVMARAIHDEALAADIGKRLERYQEEQSYRESE
jgi:tetratricopeptide (TPR) repeat protein